MKKYLLAILLVVSVLLSAAAPSMATPAVFVDFEFKSLDVSHLNTSGIGYVVPKTSISWAFEGWESDQETLTGSISITGGRLGFASGGKVTLTGTLLGATITLEGQASGFTYNTSGIYPVWSWSTIRWTSLAPLDSPSGTFPVFSSAYGGSFSISSTSSGSTARYVSIGTLSPVPLPSSLLLLAPSALGIMVLMRKKRKK